MKIFEYIRDRLARIRLKAQYAPKADIIEVTPEPTVQVDEQNAIKERIRKVFEQQDRDMKIRASKAHSPYCPDSWTCKEDPCFILEPDVIVKHRKNCVHSTGVVMGQPPCECGKGKRK